MAENLNNCPENKNMLNTCIIKSVYQSIRHCMRGKMSVSVGQFCALVLCLLGDKDHEKVFDIISKVERFSGALRIYANFSTQVVPTETSPIAVIPGDVSTVTPLDIFVGSETKREAKLKEPWKS